MASLNRRDFLRLGGAGLAMGTLSPLFQIPFLRRSVQAAMFGPATPKKMLVIFLRGGCDGANVLIPHGDGTYNDTSDSRPTLFVSPDDAIDLNGFASLHPSMAKMHEIWQANNLACLHRVAYQNQSRSHFSSQQYWENAVPGNVGLEEGWVNRYIDSNPLLDGNDLAGVSVSNQLQVLFRGERVLTHIPNLATYTLGSGSDDLKLLGSAPQGGDNGSGLLGVYSRTPDGTSYDGDVRNTGLVMAGSLDALQVAGIDPSAYMPVNGATYPSADAPGDFPGNFTAFNFFRQVKDSVQLLKESDAAVCGVELGGFDSHSNQGALTGTLPGRMHMVSHAMRSVWQDTDPSGLWDDLLVVTLSEFGRTSEENGSFGTDHGEASCMFVAGGSVNPVVRNCDSTTWAEGDLFSTPNGRYISHLTDFRAVLAEMLDKHFGVSGMDLDPIIPGWSGFGGDPKFDYLDFMTATP